MRVIPILITAYLTIVAACSPAHTGGHAVTASDGTQWHPLTVERLPDLPTPRGSHRTVAIGDEIVLLGGQTDGFKPLETAEYYSKGAWHTVPMLYPHINGFASRLPDSRILLGGGSEEHFGIGQSFGAELYDPETHSFTSVGIMSAKRSLPSALTLPDGSVVVAGNWYAADSWETWSPDEGFVPGETLSPGWAEPYILPASADDIIVFGPWDTRGDGTGGRVDHLGGRTEFNSLLEGCTIYANYYVFPEDYQIADCTYLIPVVVDSLNTPAILKVASGEFSLLELETPLSANGPHGNPLTWGALQVDRPAHLAWVQGFDPVTGSMCFARIAYDATFDGGKASVTYFFADQAGGFPFSLAKLLPGGRLILAGGTGWKPGVFPTMVDNFKAYSSAWIFCTEPPQKAAVPLWTIAVCILVIGGGHFADYPGATQAPQRAGSRRGTRIRRTVAPEPYGSDIDSHRGKRTLSEKGYPHHRSGNGTGYQQDLRQSSVEQYVGREFYFHDYAVPRPVRAAPDEGASRHALGRRGIRIRLLLLHHLLPQLQDRHRQDSPGVENQITFSFLLTLYGSWPKARFIIVK